MIVLSTQIKVVSRFCESAIFNTQILWKNMENTWEAKAILFKFWFVSFPPKKTIFHIICKPFLENLYVFFFILCWAPFLKVRPLPPPAFWVNSPTKNIGSLHLITEASTNRTSIIRRPWIPGMRPPFGPRWNAWHATMVCRPWWVPWWRLEKRTETFETRCCWLGCFFLLRKTWDFFKGIFV